MDKFEKALIAGTLALVMVATGALHARAAETVTVTRTVYGIGDFPALEAKAKAVCAGSHKLSDGARTVCASGKWPSVTKAGAFRNAGVGAELNTLMRQ